MALYKTCTEVNEQLKSLSYHQCVFCDEILCDIVSPVVCCELKSLINNNGVIVFKSCGQVVFSVKIVKTSRLFLRNEEKRLLLQT